MNLAIPQMSIALPEMFLLGMVCVILVVDACVKQRHQIVTYYLVQATLIGAFLLVLPEFGEFSKPVFTFGGNYILDKLTVLSKLFIYLFSFFAHLYARDYIENRKIARSEFYLLSLLAVLGMSVMASAYTFLTIYLGLELLSLALYALVAMDRSSKTGPEAAMKYFALGALASGFLLYGISLMYGLTGSIQLHDVGMAVAKHHDLVPVIGLIFILCGLIFKFGAVPFHMWVPDVYQGSPTPVTLFISSAPKIAAFTVLLRILSQAAPSLQADWQQMLIVMSVLSMFLGNLLAIAQTNLKRMFAYSSIAHVGYTLLGIIAGPNSTQGYSAAMFYIATYVLVAAGAFAVIIIMSRDGVDFDKLDDYRGLNARNPWLAFMMLLLLFSMAGVPPTVGFFAKLGLLEALIQAQHVWLAVAALLFALIGVFYYLRVVKLMYFDEPIPELAHKHVGMSKRMYVAISLNGVAALVLGVLPSFVIDICRISVG